MKTTAGGWMLGAMVAILGAGCAATTSAPSTEYPPPTAAEQGQAGLVPSAKKPAALGISEADLPPPGRCRVWYPGRDASQQPPAGDCDQLSNQVPKGAWLITRPVATPEYVHVVQYDVAEPGLQAAVRVFEAATGRFLREITPTTNENQKPVATPVEARR